MSVLSPILVAAVALIRNRRVLMVTARGRDVLFMPGGKIDPGESTAEAAAREAYEEVALTLSSEALVELFTVRVQAHGEPEGRQVHMTVFSADSIQEPMPSAEVSEVHWAGTEDLHRCPPAGAEVVLRLAELGLID